MRRKKKKTKKGILVARCFIYVGLAMILFSVIYEAANFPWKTWFGSEESNFIDDMPDPTPPADNDIIYDAYDPNAQGERYEVASGGLFEEPERDDEGFVHLTLLGTIKIPRLELATNIFEGATQTELLYGCGHVVGSPMPGEAGNVSIAGHRVTMRNHPFRHIDKMRKGDVVFIHYQDHVYTYTTYELFIVHNTENWVMDEVEDEPYCLTLISCHPPGSARQRYILRARLTDVDGITLDEYLAIEGVASEE